MRFASRKTEKPSRGQLFTLDLLTAAVVFTAVLGISIHLYEANQRTFTRTVEEQSNSAEAMAEMIVSGEIPNVQSCWCARITRPAGNVYDSCAGMTCFDSCSSISRAMRLTAKCLGLPCPCETEVCALEVRAC